MSTDAADYARLLAAVRRADLLARRAADQRLTAQLGLGRATFLILDMLAENAADGVSQQTIADTLGLTRAAVSRHVRTARERGWVQVHCCSGRENSVTLTAAGSVLVDQGRRTRARAARTAVATLGIESIRSATRTIEELCALLDP